MNCQANERRYTRDIFMDFSIKCNKEIYLDEDFPVTLHFYMDDEDTAKIMLRLYYDNKNIYAQEKLNDIKSALETIASEFDLSLSTMNKDYSIPNHKLGGRGKEKKIINDIIDGKECIRYSFIIKPDYLSEKYTN